MAVTNLTGANQLIRSNTGANSLGVYRGFSVRETAGAAAVVRIFDNTAASGTLLEEISLAANESAREFYIGGVPTVIGIFVQVVSGAVTGSVRVD